MKGIELFLLESQRSFWGRCQLSVSILSGPFIPKISSAPVDILRGSITQVEFDDTHPTAKEGTVKRCQSCLDPVPVRKEHPMAFIRFSGSSGRDTPK